MESYIINFKHYDVFENIRISFRSYSFISFNITVTLRFSIDIVSKINVNCRSDNDDVMSMVFIKFTIKSFVTQKYDIIRVRNVDDRFRFGSYHWTFRREI